jgi:hypothetical protein
MNSCCLLFQLFSWRSNLNNIHFVPWMESCFISDEGEVIVIMNSDKYSTSKLIEAVSWNISCVYISFILPAKQSRWFPGWVAEVVRQCPLASSERDIVVDRAGVRTLAACFIMMRGLVTFSHFTMKLFRIVRSSKWENILSCKGSNPCSVNYNILPRRGQWSLANLLSQQNIGKNRSIMTKYIKSAE